VKTEGELWILRKQYEKKKRTYKKRLSMKDGEIDKLEQRLRKVGDRNVFNRRLEKKTKEKDSIIQYYSVALSNIGNKIDDVTERLKKDNISK